MRSAKILQICLHQQFTAPNGDLKMFKNSTLKKSSSLLAATIITAATVMPTSTASAHDRHNPNRHYGSNQHLNKHQHRQFHNRFGRGQHGTKNYRAQLRRNQNHTHVKRRNKKGELIAAGIIGLAVGAIIASEASKRKQRRYEPSYSDFPHQQRFPQQSYNDSNLSGSDYSYGTQNQGPEVITFNEPRTLEPWTAGWREWCQNRYRSFNPSTGTFRGYDGFDHFCVPK